MPKPSAQGLYVTGAALARTGDEMSGPALLLLALAVTGSASSASSLLAALTVAAALGGPLFGALLDRARRPGRLLAGALALYAAALIVMLLALGRAPVGVALVVAVGAGLLGPALSGGWTSQLPHAVRESDLPRANALDAMTFDAASLAGPALAGGVAALAGARAGVAVSAALIAAALPVAWRLRTPGERDRVREREARESVSSGVAAGFRVLIRSRALARATVASVLSCAGEGVFVAVTPLLGALSLGGAHHGALLLSVSATGALAANAVLARSPLLVRPDAALGPCTALLAVAMLLAATTRPVLVLVGAALTGCAVGPQLTALFAIRHREAPERLRGQVFTTGASLKITGFALGAALAGPLAARSVPAALLAAAGFQVLAALVCRLVRVGGYRCQR
ncbi:MFS transporter [Streptomyces sp. NBC_00237]|uniref:MFS transporter n=1 Tax=Streptomyces sp. NBC_00237 TaxID=2975687 RepID=UPI002255CFE5|nr:MFS transporter [Streptomyces sp. NBC_00237]MCX5203400.1 MFS transporter [Streptomyces sp. NBC_00237]